MDLQNVLPEKYILNRWKKDLKRKHQFIKSSYDPLIGNPTAERYSDLCKHMFELASIGATTIDNYTIVKNHVLECHKKLSGPRSEQIPPFQSLPNASTTGNVSSDMAVESQNILSPHVVCTKGKRASKRKMSEVEKVVVKKSKGINHQASDTNPKPNKKKKQTCQRSLQDELDTNEIMFPFETDSHHGAQNNVVMQTQRNSQSSSHEDHVLPYMFL